MMVLGLAGAAALCFFGVESVDRFKDSALCPRGGAALLPCGVLGEAAAGGGAWEGLHFRGRCCRLADHDPTQGGYLHSHAHKFPGSSKCMSGLHFLPIDRTALQSSRSRSTRTATKTTTGASITHLGRRQPQPPTPSTRRARGGIARHCREGFISTAGRASVPLATLSERRTPCAAGVRAGPFLASSSPRSLFAAATPEPRSYVTAVPPPHPMLALATVDSE
ncbi:hypothetical protein B0H14DRAFT_321113 [Mycena olivaceomarginata]|nr:hypothetical protein B0H14DRAFT_321113 [Mycena olivaceomarginata]